ncbi:MAG TPA: sulfurtransferase [Salinivirgaceae bacterium]|nr:sulfurtransferase [Salinivirgaceae bacterium]
MRITPIIEVEELLKIYKNQDVMIFSVSLSSKAKANYEAEHLEGAFFVDISSQLADIKSNFANGGRHPLPKIETFSKTLTDMGVAKEKHIVIYDDTDGSNGAARFWWMLKSVGHEKVQILNGGINQAKKIHFPLSSEIEIIKGVSEPYQVDKWILPTVEINEVENVSQNLNYLVIDVRSEERYKGITEPIDLIAGHIPGAINIPFTENTDDIGLFLEPDKLREKYKKRLGEIRSENIIVHCGSGVTACHTLLALDYAGMGIPKLYVGSWSEWSRNNKQIAKNTYSAGYE